MRLRHIKRENTAKYGGDKQCACDNRANGDSPDTLW